MDNLIQRIESLLEHEGQPSELREKDFSGWPDKLIEIHQYKVFGANLLAIPAELIIAGDEEEYERPFSFMGLIEGLENFENEFRAEIPNHFMPFGYLDGASEIVLYNSQKDAIHIFNVADIVDKEWMQHKLDNPKCSFEQFIKSIRPQTVTCLINPNDFSEAILIEIRNGNKIYCDYEFKELKIEVWHDYINICNSYLDKGFEVHYASNKFAKKQHLQS